MSPNLFGALLLVIALPVDAQTTHALQSGNLVFIPNSLDIFAGDSIQLTLVADHTLTEVTEETWNANGNTPNGGSNFGPGTPDPGPFHTFSIDIPGTYWFVCIPPAGMGMKCVIHVAPSTVEVTGEQNDDVSIHPNPANDRLVVRLPTGSKARLRLFERSGREAMQAEVGTEGTLDLNSLPSGTYLAELIDTGGNILMRRTLVIAP